ncbi:MAG: peptidase inhibitor family I36 protein [Pseudonocardiaceae bacterium]
MAGMVRTAFAIFLIGGAGVAYIIATPPTAVDDGQIFSSTPERVTPATLGRDQPCPAGWLCLYEHPDFNRDQDGRMLKFRDDYWQRFDDYGFQDQTSSWKNHLGYNACLSGDWPPENRRLPLAGCASAAVLGNFDDTARGVKPGDC